MIPKNDNLGFEPRPRPEQRKHGLVPVELREAAAEELGRDQAEAVRAAYVAATRARDLLVTPVCGDQSIEGWLEMLNPMLYPPNNSRRRSVLAPGCPAFGSESVLERGPDSAPPADGPVKPGLHQMKADGPPVVWWDPSTLQLDVEEQAPLRHQRILEADAQRTAGAASEESYAAWMDGRRALLARASQPSLSVRTVTSLAHADRAETSHSGDGSIAPGYPDVLVEMVERGRVERPGGRRFGALVHAILASIDLSADADAIEASATINGRLFGATEEEIQAAIVTVGVALTSAASSKPTSLITTRSGLTCP